jgi:hypothetical protein
MDHPVTRPLPSVALAKLNHLVGEAHDAQEAFDNWDQGRTWVASRPRECTLAEVVAEWDEANAKLIAHVLANADALSGVGR